MRCSNKFLACLLSSSFLSGVFFSPAVAQTPPAGSSQAGQVAGAQSPASAEPVLRVDDRLVWIGPTWVERDVNYGQVETELRLKLAGQPFMLRNLGWSGDTVWAESRGIFDPPAVGYQRLLELTRELKPTTVWLAYGANESWAGPARLEQFLAQYRKLATEIQSQTGARLVFVTPFPFAGTVPPQRDPSGQNAVLAQYVGGIQKLAKELNAPVIDLYTTIQKSADLRTDNGLHPDAQGERVVAQALVCQFKFLTAENQPVSAVVVSEADREQLRQLVVAKNTLFFHRWRPQNITYLTGFRKHEQGNNAVEIAQFDPLVANAETAIQEWVQAHTNQPAATSTTTKP